MADSRYGNNLPQDIVKLFEVKMTTEPLFKFLADMNKRLKDLEAKNQDLEARIKNLEG